MDPDADDPSPRTRGARKSPEPAARLGWVEREHEEILARLTSFERTARRIAAGPTPQRVLAASLEELLALLEAHFRREEGKEFFEAVLDEDPRFEGAINRLRDEHRHLLAEARRLRDISSELEQRARDVARQGAKFAAELRLHERQENALLHDVFCQDLGSGG